MVQAGGVPDDVVMDVGLVHMGTDDKGVFPFGKAPRQLIAQAVGLLRGDLAGDEGLPDGIGDHIIGPALPAGPGLILPLGQQKLCIGAPAVTLIAGDQPAAVRLVRVLHIVNDVTDGLAHAPALAGVQGHNAGGCHDESLPVILTLPGRSISSAPHPTACHSSAAAPPGPRHRNGLSHGRGV